MGRSTAQIGFNTVGSNAVLYLDSTNTLSYSGTGTKWYDLTGNGNNFTLNGSPTFTAGGPIQFNYNGGNQYATCDNTTFGNFNSGGFTLEVIYSLVGTTDSNYSAVITHRNGMCCLASSGRSGWSWSAAAGAGIFIQDEIGLQNLTQHYMMQPSMVISPRVGTQTYEHHIITLKRDSINFKGISGSFYRNSALQSDDTRAVLSGSGAITYSGNTTLFYSAEVQANYTTGSVYLVRAYDYALSAGEVSSLYNSVRVKYGF
jgi:hypothetical protein